jgi:hypothetical protein
MVHPVASRAVRVGVPLCGASWKEAAMDFPKCLKCNRGALIPLSDYGQEGASVLFKAWVCTNPECGFSLRVDKGEVTYGKKIDVKH